MPTPTPFSLAEYASNPSYPAVLEVRLTTSPLPTANPNDLTQYAEATFPGYQRMTGPRGSLFNLPIAGAREAFLDSKLLTWRATAAATQTITAALIVATFPAEAPQLVAVIPAGQAITPDNRGISVSARLFSSKLVL